MSAEVLSEPNGRRYRSKKQRPCDVCRSRKIQCKLQGTAAACEMCRKLDRPCTFILGPLTRKYRGYPNSDAGGRAQTAAILADERQHGPALPEMSLPNGTDPRMAMDVDPFWLPGDLHHSPRTASDLLTMNWWSTVDVPLALTPNEAVAGPRAESSGTLPRIADLTSSLNVNLPAASGNVPGSAASIAVSSLSPTTAPDSETQLSPPIAVNPQIQHLLDSPTQQTVPGANPMDAIRGPPPTWATEFSLESRKAHSNQLIGLSCESDPYLLRHYYYNEHDTFPMFRLHFRKVVDDATMPRYDTNTSTIQSQPPCGPMPVQFVIADEEIWGPDVKAAEDLFSGNNTEELDMELLCKLVPPGLGTRLLFLYTRFVHPRFPVLALRDLQRVPDTDCCLSFPVGIRSAVYALAAPFTFLDDELSVSKGYLQVPTDELWAVAHRSFQRASRLSHLSSLQLCLLLLQMPPHSYVAAEPPSFWALSCSALALAESLGVNLDPSDWRLPREEVILRRRLWWLTYTVHTWQALVGGRPSHINDANWDVTNLRPDDFEGGAHDDPDIRETILQQVPICLAQCELGVIAADVLREFYTLKANRDSPTLSALLSRAQPLRTRIEIWRQTLPLLSKPVSDLTDSEFEHGAFLRLSHLTLEILIFRALLRPLTFHATTPADSSREPISTIFENAFTCAKVAAEMVSSFQSKHFASFWPPYVRYQLCYVSTFLLMNLAQSPSRDAAVRNWSLLNKWRNTLRIQARAWPLARLAAMRLDAVFWKGVSTVIHGAGPDSPGVILLKEQGGKGSGER